MSKSLNAAAIAQFDGEVKQAYQAMGVLRGTVRVRTGVVGSTHRFPKLGAGIATQRVPQTDVTPMNLAHTNRTATLSDWNAAEFTDIFDQQKVNFSERAELAFSIAGAITRREDQLIIDALDAASTTLTVSTNIGGTATGMNTAKFRRAKRLLDAGNVGTQITLASGALLTVGAVAREHARRCRCGYGRQERDQDSGRRRDDQVAGVPDRDHIEPRRGRFADHDHDRHELRLRSARMWSRGRTRFSHRGELYPGQNLVACQRFVLCRFGGHRCLGYR